MDVLHGAVDEERQLEYFEASRAAWAVHMPATFAKLEVNMKGPYALGDDPVREPRVSELAQSPIVPARFVMIAR